VESNHTARAGRQTMATAGIEPPTLGVVGKFWDLHQPRCLPYSTRGVCPEPVQSGNDALHHNIPHLSGKSMLSKPDSLRGHKARKALSVKATQMCAMKACPIPTPCSLPHTVGAKQSKPPPHLQWGLTCSATMCVTFSMPFASKCSCSKFT
jgi:hypothetical protein